MSEALAAYNVAALYPDDETAKGAVFALRREGIAPSEISVLGRMSDEVLAGLKVQQLEIPHHEKAHDNEAQNKILAKGAIAGASLAAALATPLDLRPPGRGGVHRQRLLGSLRGYGRGRVERDGTQRPHGRFLESHALHPAGPGARRRALRQPGHGAAAAAVLESLRPIRLDYLTKEGVAVSADYVAPADVNASIADLEASLDRLKASMAESAETDEQEVVQAAS